tara:strand:- start:5025 stop:8408 length:3384 start_codon:yes stop_codon:yes gene_type:complete
MIKEKINTNINRLFRGLLIFVLSLMISCDLKGPASFKMPTWFFDLMFPLVQQKYSLEGMVDNKQIFSTPDSLGMQLMFEGAFPDTSIGGDILEIDLDKSITFQVPSINGVNFPFSIDSSIKASYPVAPNGELTNSAGQKFTVPPSIDQTITIAAWNAIAAATTPSFSFEIPIPSPTGLPDFVESIVSFSIKKDAGISSSSYNSKFTKDGLPSSVTFASSTLKTEINSINKILAYHQDDEWVTGETQATSLSDSSLGSKLTISSEFQLSQVATPPDITLIDHTQGAATTAWVDTWQKFTPDRNAPLGGIFIKLENPNASSYNLALEIYASDGDPTATDPNSKFSGVPFDKSDAVTINGNIAAQRIEFPFSSGKSFNSGTNYYFWIKEEGAQPAGIGGIKVTIDPSLSGNKEGAASNSFCRLDHKVTLKETGNLITIKAGDNVKVDMEFNLKIVGIDSALVQIAEKEIPFDLEEPKFPTVVEIFSGKLKSPSAADINEIKINNITSDYPAGVSLLMNFKNFKPPAGKDSTKLDTVLKKGVTISKIYDLDGFTFYNPAGKDSALSKLSLETSAKLKAQTSSIPLDGSKLGGMTVDVGIKGLHFESMEANIIQEFPTTEFSIAGMPLGFSGMQFVDTKLEIEMYNGIRLPVVLDFDMIGVNQKGDTSKVNALSTLARPAQSKDTTKTIVRLSELGTTTLKYQAPGSNFYFDSTTVSAKDDETTIVELMSSNPANFTVKSRARIDGRGTLEAGMSIGGKYRMLAPFEVIMEPMTFISVTNTPIQEMNYENRNRIRSTLQSASMLFSIENKIPIAGDLSMLMSNLQFFPLDTTVAALRDFKDSLVVKKNWLTSDSVYIVTKCDSLNPETSDIFIFDVLTDFSECVDNVSYLVRNSSGSDTVVSYVDTLVKIPLPEPKSLHVVTNSGVHAGQVREAGFITYSSPLSKERVKLMTDAGQPYMAPRFFLKGSDGKRVYLTTGDYLDINSSVTFSLSSTGMSDPAPNEIVVKYPNGGESLDKDLPMMIKWKTYGSVSKVDLAYFVGGKPDADIDDGWTDITTEISNVDSFSWTPSSTTGIDAIMSSSKKDSVRIRVKSTDGKTRDMSGWFFSLFVNSSSIDPENNSNQIIIKGLTEE